MAKVFTIAQGLENMGAMRTGGQGSVYKGRRIGEIITAIKLLPTPIFSESDDNKNYRDFKNEVEKLKKVNEEPCANVVRILSSGLSETGSFPYIEMEYIEGPDLEELLQPPHDPIFTIKETLKVANHLSNALSHCHKKDISHGDVKSNNVKYNLHTNNYVLLDFGLAVMSDEQRRTSLRQAGAVEFMAPEQNEGQMLFQSDVYSFGVIMFELLAGRVPFPLADKGETARNAVRLAHMETLPPDVVELRKKALPDGWDKDKKDAEMNMPEWFINLIYKCLKKKPENRFKDGVQLHDYIVYHCTRNPLQNEALPDVISKGVTLRLENENEQLVQQIAFYKQELAEKEREIEELKSLTGANPVSSSYTRSDYYHQQRSRGVSLTAFFLLLLLTIGFGAFSLYSYFNNSTHAGVAISDSLRTDTSAVAHQKADTAAQKTEQLKKHKPVLPEAKKDSLKRKENKTQENKNTEAKDTTDVLTQSTEANFGIRYKVTGKAYFYDEPDEATRRKSFLNASENDIFIPLKEEKGFIYISGTNQFGKKTSGWLKKTDLQEVDQ